MKDISGANDKALSPLPGCVVGIAGNGSRPELLDQREAAIGHSDPAAETDQPKNRHLRRMARSSVGALQDSRPRRRIRAATDGLKAGNFSVNQTFIKTLQLFLPARCVNSSPSQTVAVVTAD